MMITARSSRASCGRQCCFYRRRSIRCISPGGASQQGKTCSVKLLHTSPSASVPVEYVSFFFCLFETTFPTCCMRLRFFHAKMNWFLAHGNQTAERDTLCGSFSDVLQQVWIRLRQFASTTSALLLVSFFVRFRGTGHPSQL